MPVERESSFVEPINGEALEIEVAEEPVQTDLYEGEDVLMEELDDGGMEITFGPDEYGAEPTEDGNLAMALDEIDLAFLSSEILSLKDEFKAGREKWEKTYAKGLEALGFELEEERQQPFIGASGVSHPVLAEAATQFSSHAYKELFPSRGPVKTAIFGKKTPERHRRAQRLKDFFNYHLTETMVSYEDDFDAMLFQLPLAGSAFKKTYWDVLKGREESVFVPAERVFVPYGTANLEDCECLIELIDMPMNQLEQKQERGHFIDVAIDEGYLEGGIDEIQVVRDDIAGEEVQIGTSDFSVQLLEAHIMLDLPGFESETGLKLPYIITLTADSGKILRITRNSDDINPFKKKEYYTHYKFMQGFGFYGHSLIHMIGNLTKAATGALRALLDAGAFGNLPSGFKSRSMRVEGDNAPLQPGEFRDVDVVGGNIRDAIVPLPFKGADQTLYQLLGFLVNAAQRFASTTDINVGDGNENAPVGTMSMLLESGQRVLTAVHKRVHRAHKHELKLIGRSVRENPRPYPPFIDIDEEGVEGPADDLMSDVGILPVTDPEMFSQPQRIALAQAELKLAQSAPDIHDLPEAFRNMYEALGTQDIDRILLTDTEDDGIPIPKDPAREHIDMLEGAALHAFEGQNHDAHIMSHLVQGLSQVTQANPKAAIALHKHVLEHVQLKAKDTLKMQLNQMISAGQLTEEDLRDPELAVQMDATLAQIIAQEQQNLRQLTMQLSGANAPPPPDPLVELKKTELAQNAQNDQAEIALEQRKQALEEQKAAHKQRHDAERLAQTEEINEERLANSLERIRLQASLNRNKGSQS